VRGRTLLPTLLLAATFVPLIPMAARGQSGDDTTTRTSMLTAEREAKSTTLAPPERSFAERKLYWYDNQYVLDKVFAGWHGFHMAGGDFPAGAGTKFGIGFDRGLGGSTSRPNRIDFSARAATSTRGYTRVAGSVGMHPFTAPIALSVGAQRYEFPEEDFFGFGTSSLHENRSDYLLKGTDVGADLRWTPLRVFAFEAGLWRVRPESSEGSDPRFPTVGERFDAATLPGYGLDLEFIRTDIGAAIDVRDNPAHPKAGGRYGVKLASYRPQDSGAFEFRRVEVDLQHYVPLPNRYRTLALRASAVFTDPGANDQVPFYYQPALGGAQALRGFREFRFRDRHSVVMSAEYRWEAWWAMDGAFFVDVGQVASSRKGFALDAMEASYGVGFRIHSNRAFVSRLDLAFSREGFIPLLRFEHAF